MHISYLQRYNEGECVAVWDELIALGKDVRKKAVVFDALEVARETMRRVKLNSETLVERLNSLGFRFEGTAYKPPLADATDNIEGFEEMAGLLPISIRAFYEIVGQIDLRESFTKPSQIRLTVESLIRDDGGAYSDPLVVYPIEEAIEEYQVWEEDVEEMGRKEVGLYRLPIGPDQLHKANISGGDYYGLQLPNEGIDAVLMEGDIEEWHHTTFVNYLRKCFKWGGFPGWERYRQHPNFPAKELAFLTRDLVPF